MLVLEFVLWSWAINNNNKSNNNNNNNNNNVKVVKVYISEIPLPDNAQQKNLAPNYLCTKIKNFMFEV